MQAQGLKRKLIVALLAGFLLPAGPAALAQAEVETPYWASIQREEAFGRAGPMASYQIEWVFRRPNLPVKVVKRYGVWRQIQDPDGWVGWMHSNMLSRKRTAIITGSVRAIRSTPKDSAKLLWRVEPGVVGMLGDCEKGWCEFSVDRYSGWVRQDQLWGAGEP
jgi:SH3-like domain-containing protein